MTIDEMIQDRARELYEMEEGSSLSFKKAPRFIQISFLERAQRDPKIIDFMIEERAKELFYRERQNPEESWEDQHPLTKKVYQLEARLERIGR